jgi:hypothetical protein
LACLRPAISTGSRFAARCSLDPHALWRQDKVRLRCIGIFLAAAVALRARRVMPDDEGVAAERALVFVRHATAGEVRCGEA